MKNLKTITLPTPEEIARRMAENFGSSDHDKRLWAEIARHGGRALNGGGIVNVLNLAISDYIEKGGYPAFLGSALLLMRADYIAALIDDAEVRQGALDFMDEVEARK